MARGGQLVVDPSQVDTQSIAITGALALEHAEVELQAQLVSAGASARSARLSRRLKDAHAKRDAIDDARADLRTERCGVLQQFGLMLSADRRLLNEQTNQLLEADLTQTARIQQLSLQLASSDAERAVLDARLRKRLIRSQIAHVRSLGSPMDVKIGGVWPELLDLIPSAWLDRALAGERSSWLDPGADIGEAIHQISWVVMQDRSDLVRLMQTSPQIARQELAGVLWLVWSGETALLGPLHPLVYGFMLTPAC